MVSFAKHEMLKSELRPEENLPCWILLWVNKWWLKELLNTREGQVEVEQHRFVEQPVNTSSGVASAIAGSSGEKQRKPAGEAFAGQRISQVGTAEGQRSQALKSPCSGLWNGWPSAEVWAWRAGGARQEFINQGVGSA